MYRQHDQELASLISTGPIVVYTCEAYGNFAATSITPNIKEQLGHDPEEFLSEPGFWASNIHPDDREVVFKDLGNLFEKGAHSHEYRFLHKDGSYRWMHDDLRLIVDDSGRPETIVGYWTDITTRKEVELALNESEARFRDFTESGSDWFWEQDAEFKFKAITSYGSGKSFDRANEAIGLTRWDFIGVNPDQDDRWRRHVDDLLAHRSFRDFRYNSVDTEGKDFHFSVNGKPTFDEYGEFTGYRGTVTNITELVDSSDAMERFSHALYHIPEGIALWDAEGRFVLANPPYLKLVEPAVAELVPGISYEKWLRVCIKYGAVPEAVGQEEAWVVKRLSHFQSKVDQDELLRNGRWQKFYFAGLPDGSTMQINIDIDEHKQNEAQLHQYQKMEAVGQLTGGIAHDFNNLLNIVMGKAELLNLRAEWTEKAQSDVDAIIGAVQRGASLTQRLLAFSRQQVLSPRPTAVNDLVRGLDDMLQRTLGETIELHTHLGSSPCVTLIDPHQFENALVNLAINAKHSMPSGGKLIIETTDTALDDAYVYQHNGVTPGDYVQATVSDTGTGMPPEVLEKAFDPFFTTKDVGEGSGLGLSMVYGFVEQSGGHITLESEVGHGTTVKLYLPRSREAIYRGNLEEEIPEPAPGSGRILLVEDDEGVREIPTSILRDQGYEVVEARDGEEAIKLLEENQPFDLLFTDVVLPGGIDGVEIAGEAKRLQPDIKVLYTTGYANDAFADVGEQVFDSILINKPYRRAELLEKVQGVLESEDD